MTCEYQKDDMTARKSQAVSNKAQPFLKWVGGKRGLLSQILPLAPKKFKNYFEPFVGGGALFFELYSKGYLENKNIYLFDINTELINTYNMVKDNPIELINELEKFKVKHSKEFYYQVRQWDRNDDFLDIPALLRAARFIYLNKTCFNGLYRVNRNNQYNVPIGKYKNPNICDPKVILDSSKALQKCIIKNTSYKSVLELSKSEDFVYLDPPYYPLSATASFTSYSAFEFLDKEQNELCEVFKKLDRNGCKLLHSNSDTNFIRTLHKEYEQINIQANRFINSKAISRGKISELIVKNF